jgi:hypothetical protein
VTKPSHIRRARVPTRERCVQIATAEKKLQNFIRKFFDGVLTSGKLLRIVFTGIEDGGIPEEANIARRSSYAGADIAKAIGVFVDGQFRLHAQGIWSLQKLCT